MPSDAQMTQWLNQPKSRPKKVRKKMSNYGVPASAPPSHGGGGGGGGYGHPTQGAPSYSTGSSKGGPLKDVDWNEQGSVARALGESLSAVYDQHKGNKAAYKAALERKEEQDAEEEERGAPDQNYLANPALAWEKQISPDIDLNISSHPTRGTSAEYRAARKAKVERIARKKARADALGISAGALTTTPPELKQLTEEAYYNLSPKQRAAVDFNTMLSTATAKDKRRDLDREDDVARGERMVYDRTVEKMFGKGHGSDLYAPETVAVLRQLNITDKAADLDDYLDMKVAITSKDLKEISSTPVPNQVIEGRAPEEDTLRLQILDRHVVATQDLQEKLLKGKQMVQDFQTEAARAREDRLARMGTASPLATRGAPGFGSNRPEFDDFLRQGFEKLSVAKGPEETSQVLDAIKKDMAYEGDDFGIFAEYVDDRTSNARFYGAELGTGNESVKKWKPAERYRELLGLSR